MLKIYGSMLCPDCTQCREELDKAQVEYEYLDFGYGMKNLKEFLAIRDGSELFDEARAKGSIGIPCIVREDGSVTLSWEEFIQ
ncbi:MAG: glutaredoxin [Oscillospiraceae bacterium]|nr:glutaredoxin [Oscillospiraceae bacterium]